MRTFMAKTGEINRNWVVVDVGGKVLGRAASRIAMILRGKTKPTFTPHVDMGDFVVAVNAGKLVLTGKKDERKIYYRHTGFPGGIKTIPAGKMRADKPAQLLKLAVRGMLPKNHLGRQMLKKLKVFAGPEHKHQAQKPVARAI